MTRARATAVALVLASAIATPSVAEEKADTARTIPPVLDLVTAQRIALQDNPSLYAAEERVEQAAARIRQARSQYFPQVQGNGSIIHTDLSDNSLLQLPPGADDSIEQYNASLDASWLIFDGFARKFRNAFARFDRELNAASYRESQRLLLSAVASAFYNVQLARENIAIAKADEAFNQRQLVESQARQRVGTGSLSDVLNFQVRVRDAKTRLLIAEGAFDVALIALAELMGVPEAQLPPGTDVSPLHPETGDELEAPDAQGQIEYAFAHRPDLDRSRALIDQADAGLGIQKAEYYPTIAAIASYDGERVDSAQFENDDFAGIVGVTVSIDIFTGGRRRAQLQEARAFQSETERLYDRTELTVASEVRRSLRNLITAQRELELQRETTQYVEQNRDLVEKEYDAGQGSLVRLNEAQRDLITQRGRLAQALVSLRSTWHDLRTATGEVLEPYSAD